MSKALISLPSSVSPFLLFNPVVLTLRHWVSPLVYPSPLRGFVIDGSPVPGLRRSGSTPGWHRGGPTGLIHFRIAFTTW
jgi:hypothetical protein